MYITILITHKGGEVFKIINRFPTREEAENDYKKLLESTGDVDYILAECLEGSGKIIDRKFWYREENEHIKLGITDSRNRSISCIDSNTNHQCNKK